MARSFMVWCVVLVGMCLTAPYALGVRPRTRRDWTLLAIAIGFLLWLLAPLEVPLRTR